MLDCDEKESEFVQHLKQKHAREIANKNRHIAKLSGQLVDMQSKVREIVKTMKEDQALERENYQRKITEVGVKTNNLLRHSYNMQR